MKKTILILVIAVVAIVAIVIFKGAKPPAAVDLTATPKPTSKLPVVSQPFIKATATPSASSSATPTTKPVQVDVDIANSAFSPATLTVARGTTVVWHQKDSMYHSVVSSDGLFTSDVMTQGGTYSFKFNTAGEFNYHCGLHPSMTGKIIVQ